MKTTHILILEAASTFFCQKEDGSFYSPSITIKKGKTVSITVPLVITATTIFTQPNNSQYIDDIISQFHEKGLMISKNQLSRGYWNVIDDFSDANF
ncbi:MAG: hypothetical protein HDS11_02255 [Bacteroides sp.]|nr:hypothetical protein [Bacteroides sp.]